jgi:hypothetical protein
LATNEAGQSKNAVSLMLTTNPVSNGIASVRYTNAKNGSLAIYDLSGTLIKTVQVSKDNGDENISVSGLKTGMYLVQLKSDKGVAVAKMMVK